jgi:hypothetical protein
MLHVVSGQNPHGRYSLRLRGPAEGFFLSQGQQRRYERILCPGCTCTCYSQYGCHGDKVDCGSARVIKDILRPRLLPAQGGPR